MRCKNCGTEARRKDFNLNSVYYCECGWFEVGELECDHDYILVLFELMNGSRQLRRYCKKCHQRTRQPLKQSEYDLSEIPVKSEERYKGFIDQLNKDPQRDRFVKWLQGRKQIDFRKEYTDYLDSDQWQRVRKKVLKRDNHTCQICGMEAEQVHHLTYIHFRQEFDFELVSLCRECHMKYYHPEKVKELINQYE